MALMHRIMLQDITTYKLDGLNTEFQRLSRLTLVGLYLEQTCVFNCVLSDTKLEGLCSRSSLTLYNSMVIKIVKLS